MRFTRNGDVRITLFVCSWIIHFVVEHILSIYIYLVNSILIELCRTMMTAGQGGKAHVCRRTQTCFAMGLQKLVSSS